VAFGTSLIVERQYRKYGDKLLSSLALPDAAAGDENNGPAGEPRRSFWRRLANISETALHDFVDITVFLVLGALLAASAKQLLIFYEAEARVTDLAQSHPVAVIGMMMGLAVVLCLCSEADAFVAASFLTLPSAAKLAFLVLGPMLDLKLYMMYTRIFRPRLIWTIIIPVVLQVLFYTVLTHHLWGLWSGPGPTTAGGATGP
jgi:uncharacterized membrane protein YraQ (UPF0718 family)